MSYEDEASATPTGDAARVDSARHPASMHIAFFLENLGGGGRQKVLLIIAGELAARGHRVEVLVCKAEGPMLDQLPAGIELTTLDRAPLPLARLYALRADPAGLSALFRPVLVTHRPSETLAWLPGLVKYLRGAKPDALLTGTPYMNVEAWLACRMADSGCRLVLTEHNDLSQGHPLGSGFHARYLPALCHRAYLEADAIVTVSRGLATELAERTRIPEDRITVIYNPVVTPDLVQKSLEPLDHPWFAPELPPVILGAGRLGRAKDFLTLVSAFARVRKLRPVRLVILGAGKGKKDKPDKRETEIRELADRLGVSGDMDLQGFVANPFPFMKQAAVFAVSSRYEGFCNVIVEAMACGTPVVSTDCPSGPSEILQNGQYGPLVPVGDDAALADAIIRLLDSPTDPEILRSRAGFFTVSRAVDGYERILSGRNAAG